MARSSKRRKAKTKFKFTKELIFLLLFILVIGISTGLMGIKSKKDKLYDKITAAQQSASSSDSTITTLDEDNVYSEISYKSAVKKIKKDSYTYIYYGVYTDKTYLQYLETINQTAQTYDVKKVYLLSSAWASSIDIENSDYGEENNEVLTQVEKALCDVDLKTTPQLWVFKAGEIVFNSKDYLNDSYSPTPWNYAIQQAFGKNNNKD